MSGTPTVEWVVFSHCASPLLPIVFTLFLLPNKFVFDSQTKMVVAKPKLSYEECRRQRVEENKKRMEALNLPQLSQALRTPSFKPSPKKQVKPRTVEKQLVVVRRSGRVAKKPTPVYKEVLVEKVMIPRRVSKHRDLSNRVYASDEARAEALEKAEKLESGLEPDFPVFIKSMLQSHVTGGFWLVWPSRPLLQEKSSKA
ncbi:hypothetical protein PTKIN_Ptkin09bG0134000 [Pterospermum kingtungense]